MEMKVTYGTLYEGLNTKSAKVLIQPLYFLLRRVHLALVVVTMQSEVFVFKIFQVIVNTILASVIMHQTQS